MNNYPNNNQNNGYQKNNQYNNQYNKNFPYNHGTAKTIAIVIAAVVGFFLFWGFIGFMSDCSDRVNKDLAREDSIKRAKEMSETGTTEATPDPAPCEWDYSESRDAMTDAVRKFAEAKSIVIYGGRFAKDWLYITIRHDQRGTDVMLALDVRQFHGSEYQGTNYITLRVDDGKPQKFTYSRSDSGNTRLIFLNNAKRFISAMKNAKTCRIEVPTFREGRKVFDFNFDKPLVWK